MKLCCYMTHANRRDFIEAALEAIALSMRSGQVRWLAKRYDTICERLREFPFEFLMEVSFILHPKL